MASNIQIDGERFKDKPHGWIQWKGTQACIDLHCACGADLHADKEFLYSFVCPNCLRHYEVGSHVALYELTSEEVESWKASGGTFVELDQDLDDIG